MKNQYLPFLQISLFIIIFFNSVLSLKAEDKVKIFINFIDKNDRIRKGSEFVYTEAIKNSKKKNEKVYLIDLNGVAGNDAAKVIADRIKSFNLASEIKYKIILQGHSNPSSDVLVSTSPNGTAFKLSDIVKGLSFFKGKEGLVNLDTCNGGVCSLTDRENSLAQQVAKGLSTQVKGSTSITWFPPDKPISRYISLKLAPDGSGAIWAQTYLSKNQPSWSTIVVNEEGKRTVPKDPLYRGIQQILEQSNNPALKNEANILIQDYLRRVDLRAASMAQTFKIMKKHLNQIPGGLRERNNAFIDEYSLTRDIENHREKMLQVLLEEYLKDPKLFKGDKELVNFLKEQKKKGDGYFDRLQKDQLKKLMAQLREEGIKAAGVTGPFDEKNIKIHSAQNTLDRFGRIIQYWEDVKNGKEVFYKREPNRQLSQNEYVLKINNIEDQFNSFKRLYGGNVSLKDSFDRTSQKLKQALSGQAVAQQLATSAPTEQELRLCQKPYVEVFKKSFGNYIQDRSDLMAFKIQKAYKILEQNKDKQWVKDFETKYDPYKIKNLSLKDLFSERFNLAFKELKQENQGKSNSEIQGTYKNIQQMFNDIFSHSDNAKMDSISNGDLYILKKFHLGKQVQGQKTFSLFNDYIGRVLAHPEQINEKDIDNKILKIRNKNLPEYSNTNEAAFQKYFYQQWLDLALNKELNNNSQCLDKIKSGTSLNKEALFNYFIKNIYAPYSSDNSQFKNKCSPDLSPTECLIRMIDKNIYTEFKEPSFRPGCN